MAKSAMERAFNRDEQRQHKRQAVLKAGAKLFSERGYDRTSLDDIAAELEVSKRTLYYYVEGKDDILFECTSMAIETLDSALDQSRNRDVPPLERIEAFMREYARILSDDFGACLVRCREEVLSDASRSVLFDGFKKIDKVIRELLEEGIKEGSIAPCDTQLTTGAVFGAFNWVPYWNRGKKSRSHTEVSDQFLKILLNGIRARQ